MDLPDLIRRTVRLADLEQAKPVGQFTLYRGEAPYPVPCFLELNCKNGVYLVFFGLYYDIFRFRFHEGKILFKGELREAKQYIEADLISAIKPMRELAPVEFLARATPMPHGDMGLCDEHFIHSIKEFTGTSSSAIIGKIDALGASGKVVGLDVLKPLLRHSCASVRMHAMTAILTLPVAEAEKLKVIIQMMEDSEKMIRDLASYCSKMMFKIVPYQA